MMNMLGRALVDIPQISLAILNAEAVQDKSCSAYMKCYLIVFFKFNFNKLRKIAVKLLDVST